MTRCATTPAVLGALLAAERITPEEAAHVGTCAECARQVAALRRFDGVLVAVGRDLAPEPMPPAADVIAAGAEPTTERPMTWRRIPLAGRLAIALGIGLLVGAGGWLGSSIGFPLRQGGIIGAEQLDAWLDRAFAEVVSETGRQADPAKWEPALVETCGRTAIAFWMEAGGEGTRAYRWAVGEPMNRFATLRARGLAGSLTDPEVAQHRAELPICDVVVDVAPSTEEAMVALEAARERWLREWGHDSPARGPIPLTDELSRSRVVAVTRGNPRELWVLLDRPGESGLDRIALSAEGTAFRVEGASGGDEPTRTFVVHAEPSPGYWVYYAAFDDPSVRAVELLGAASGTLRYSVGAPGFILDIPADPSEVSSYRLLNAQGDVVGAGDLELPCGAGSEYHVAGEFFARGNGYETFCAPER